MDITEFPIMFSDDDYEYDLSRSDLKLCLACNKPFYGEGRNRSRQRYCKRTHYIVCAVCGDRVNQEPASLQRDLVMTCSVECGNKYRFLKTQQAIGAKYGVVNISQDPSTRKKMQATRQLHQKEITSKIRETMMEKYGGFGTASPELRCKIETTIRNKYGVDNVSELDWVKDKISNALKSDEVIQHKIDVSRLKWGTDYPSQSSEVKANMMKTCLQKYGVPFVGNVTKFRMKAEKTNLVKYGVSSCLMLDRVQESARKAFIENKSGRNNKVSKINREFKHRLESEMGLECDFESMIGRKSFDIVLANSNILIEIDPSYTHSDLPNHWSDKGIDPKYHLQKTEIAEQKGFRCIHIFDWDDVDKICAMLQPKNKIPARKCRIEVVTASECNEFLDKYHLQGKVKGSKVQYGLYFNDELVSVMTFGKPRYNSNYEWELLRLCTQPDKVVIGGSEKLFKRFVSDYNPTSVISYCDRSKFTGGVYYRLGFVLDHISPPAKVWSKGSKKITDNLLRQRGFDSLFNASYGKGTSNEQLMIDDGWRSVYDCGQLAFRWTNTEAK